MHSRDGECQGLSEGDKHKVNQGRLSSGVASWKWQGFEKGHVMDGWRRAGKAFQERRLKVIINDNKGDDVWGVCFESR